MNGAAGREHRLGQLLGMTVETVDGRHLGRIQDVRFVTEDDDPSDPLTIVGIIVGQRNTGALLGYDRNTTRGPWPLRALVRWLHRNAAYVEWDDIVDVGWQRGVVRVRDRDYRPLLHGS